jgi:hypothetical protein
VSFQNFTPHPINIFRQEDVAYSAEMRKFIVNGSVEPIRVIPPSGHLLNAQMGETQLEDIDEINIVKSYPLSVDAPQASGRIIVSRMYAAAAAALWQNPPEMYCVHQPVYRLMKDGAVAPCGCLGLERI